LIRFGFQLLFGTKKTTPSNSSPSIHTIINKKTNKMTNDQSTLLILIFCISLIVAQLNGMKLWEAEQRGTRGLGDMPIK